MLSQRAGQGPWFRLRGSGPRAQGASKTCIQSDSTETDVERMLRQQLAKPFPNALVRRLLLLRYTQAPAADMADTLMSCS